MRALLLVWLIGFAPVASAWQLALGGGLVAGDLPMANQAAPTTGWSFMAQWSRQPFVARRWDVNLTVGQFATDAVANGILERGRIATAALLWERRIPFTYDLRPWLGAGLGISHVRYDDRLQINAQGYAVDSYAPTSHTDAMAQVAMGLRLSRSWSVSLIGATNWPAHFSTITLTLLWRLL